MRAMLENASNNLDLVSHLHNLALEHPDFEGLHETTLNGSVRYEPEMETKICLSESHSSPTEL